METRFSRKRRRTARMATSQGLDFAPSAEFHQPRPYDPESLQKSNAQAESETKAIDRTDVSVSSAASEGGLPLSESLQARYPHTDSDTTTAIDRTDVSVSTAASEGREDLIFRGSLQATNPPSKSENDEIATTIDFTDVSVSTAAGGGLPLPGKTAASSLPPPAASEMQDLMQDHLDLMLEIVLRIREDPEFAKGIYTYCPRLQHLLDQHPNLRPLFEDPKLVRINFEQVYKKAGGILPEERKPLTLLQRFVHSPLFKLLKVILFCKKWITCIIGGGFGLVGIVWSRLFSLEDAAQQPDNEQDAEADKENEEHRDALNRAALQMEDKETQERISQICEAHDQQKLLEAIEDNPDLKALSDSNPLCAELMSDPETMKILVDPDNLRRLADTPGLIQQDFSDPHWTPPEIDGGGELDAGAPPGLEGENVPSFHERENLALLSPDDPQQSKDLTVIHGSGEPGPADVNDALDSQPEVAADYTEEGNLDVNDVLISQSEDAENTEVLLVEDMTEGDGQLEDLELEETEVDEEIGGDDATEEEEEEGMEYEHGEDEIKASASNKKSEQRQATNKSAVIEGGGGFRSFLGNMRTGLTDMVAAELVGTSMSHLTSTTELDFEATDVEAVEEDDDADVVQDLNDDADMVQDLDDGAVTLDSAAQMVESHGDTLDKLEEGVADVEEAHGGEIEEDNDRKAKSMNAAAAAPGATADAMNDVEGGGQGGGDEEEDDDDEAPEGARFGIFSSFADSVSAAFKEHVVTSVLGDDFGELVLEKVEETDEGEEKESFPCEEPSSTANDSDTSHKKDDGDAETGPLPS